MSFRSDPVAPLGELLAAQLGEILDQEIARRSMYQPVDVAPRNTGNRGSVLSVKDVGVYEEMTMSDGSVWRRIPGTEQPWKLIAEAPR